jgi:hypothetical protein
VVVSFIGGGNLNTPGKPPTCRSEETGDNNRREDIKDQVIKWGYLKGAIAKLYVPWYIFPISSSGDTAVSQ